MTMNKANTKKRKLIKPLSNKTLKREKQLCANIFCNPECKGTIFQDDEVKYNDELNKTYKKQKYLKNMLIQARKKLFLNRKTILEDNFYYKLKNKKQLKQKGALSGCTVGWLCKINLCFKPTQ
jgi:hypothetical protein